jgi:AmmeMemoRadiSam system protein B/AmmeMemoRadiSam system protein A
LHGLCGALAAAGVVLMAELSCGAGAAEDVRPPARAGQFYPAPPEVLRRDVAALLEAAAPKVPEEAGRLPLRAIVVPHAGYTYSGPTAALAYKLLEGAERPRRIVLLGPSHYAGRSRVCSVADYSAYETPLGTVPVDAAARESLTESAAFRAAKAPHETEHCIEVQLPFVQSLWPEPPAIVPVLTGSLTEHDAGVAAAGIAGLLDRGTLLIVSTDFTHYGERFGFAPFRGQIGTQLRDSIRGLDMEGVRLLQALDTEGFARFLQRKRPTICGRAGLSVMAAIFSKAPGARVEFLGWGNSGARTSSYSDCVSYVAMAVYASDEAMEAARTALAAAAGRGAAEEGGPALSAEERKTLLVLARAAMERSVRAGSMSAALSQTADLPEAIRRPGGAFVTLKVDGNLRGCIGRIAADTPMAECVERMAAAAALRDPRFRPVQPAELDGIKLEISVLSPLEPLPSPGEVRVGRDGLMITADRRSGLLLPQVPVEFGWNRVQFLEQTCRKAGLPTDAWKWEGVKIQRFGATVFGEE